MRFGGGLRSSRTKMAKMTTMRGPIKAKRYGTQMETAEQMKRIGSRMTSLAPMAIPGTCGLLLVKDPATL
jgi:hypothetical protein